MSRFNLQPNKRRSGTTGRSGCKHDRKAAALVTTLICLAIVSLLTLTIASDQRAQREQSRWFSQQQQLRLDQSADQFPDLTADEFADGLETNDEQGESPVP